MLWTLLLPKEVRLEICGESLPFGRTSAARCEVARRMISFLCEQDEGAAPGYTSDHATFYNFAAWEWST